jgi:hypothetical protein
MYVPSKDAEIAMFHSNAVKALFPRTGRGSAKGRRRSGSRLRPATQRILLEMALGRVVGVGELYLLMRATRRLKPQLLQPIPPPAKPDAMVKRLRAAAKSFPKLVELWQTDLGKELPKLADWPQFERLRDLRHVLVHRLGDWQPALDPKPRLQDRVRRLGVAPDYFRGPIPLASDDLDEAIQVALRVVNAVDRA